MGNFDIVINSLFLLLKAELDCRMSQRCGGGGGIPIVHTAFVVRMECRNSYLHLTELVRYYYCGYSFLLAAIFIFRFLDLSLDFMFNPMMLFFSLISSIHHLFHTLLMMHVFLLWNSTACVTSNAIPPKRVAKATALG